MTDQTATRGAGAPRAGTALLTVLLIAMGTRAFRLGRPDLGGDPEKPVILDGVLAR